MTDLLRRAVSRLRLMSRREIAKPIAETSGPLFRCHKVNPRANLEAGQGERSDDCKATKSDVEFRLPVNARRRYIYFPQELTRAKRFAGQKLPASQCAADVRYDF